jgi:hypothetical protein
MKWKTFELTKFIEFIFNQKVDFGDKRYSQINNDFSKFIKTGESYYECGNLVYCYKQEEYKKKRRYIYYNSEFKGGIGSIDDDKTRERQKQLNDVECHHFRTYVNGFNSNSNSDKGGEIIMSASEEVVKQYNDNFTASDLHKDADGLKDCNADSITNAIQNINSRIVDLGKQNAQTPIPTFQDDKSKLDLVLKYSEYIQTTHRLKVKAKKYTIKSFEKWFWDIAKDNTETIKQRKLIVADLTRLKTAYEQSAPFLKGRIDFYSVLSQAVKDKKKQDGDDKPGTNEDRVVCNEKMWNTFLGFASNRELRIGDEIIRTDGSDIGLTKNAAVREFISKNHKEKDYRQQIELAAKRAG